ncbi:phage virion morphogenesis protein [Hansschlegelia zhihuaiae]|uniref:Phage virion morphogenesis protein n=1 Tax=Hansschlegelia zhihuaiae TaxID=405005 RepID=A0A4Q0MMU3_9HYPH|nr:phage virion morphogenesis protein [Hansschlegelia zhihuaiae]RXF75078.1 phage virion morphogenesis protein [Hansschlegelia zhihuaiae]
MAAEGARVTIDDRAIRAAINDAVGSGAQERAMYEDIGAYMVTATQRRFEAETGPGGQKWAPFAKSTLQRMPPKRRPPRLLRDRNRLYSSIVSQAFGGGVRVGTNLAYAAIHQFGGEVKQEAREQTAVMRLVKDGAGRKVDKDGAIIRYGSRHRFAKASTRVKSRREVTFEVGARTITIPARPYLGVDPTDEAEILAIVADHKARAIGAQP